MTTLLPTELQQAIADHEGKPFSVMDPATKKLYVLVAQEQYERLKPLFEDESLSLEEQRQLLHDAGRRAGWDDPEMDAYDHYDEHRSQHT